MSRRVAVFRRDVVRRNPDRRLAPAGLAEQAAAAVVAGDAVVLATATLTQAAQAVVAGTAQVVAGAALAHPASVSVAAAAAVVADPTRSHAAQAVVAGQAGVIAQSGTPASATVAAVAGVLANATQTHAAQAVVAGVAQVTAGATQTHASTVTVAGTAAVTAGATRVHTASVSIACQAAVVADGRRVHQVQAHVAGQAGVLAGALLTRAASVTIAGAARVTATARVARPGLNVSVWAVVPAGLAPLPAPAKLDFSRERNAPGSVTLDYPAAAPGAGLLRAGQDGDTHVEVEIWLSGNRDGALRARLLQTESDDLDNRSVLRLAGHFLEQLLDGALVYPQPAPAEKGELAFTAATAGTVMATALNQAQARGALTALTRDWTTTHDSSGQPWPQTVSGLKFSPKTTLLQIAQELVELDLADFEVTRDRVLRMWAPGRRGVDRTTGNQPATFRHGRVKGAPVRHSVRTAGTSLLVLGADGKFAEVNDASALARRGERIERAVDAGQLTDTGALLAYGQAARPTVTSGQREIRHDLVFGPGDPRPGAGFDVADTVMSERQGGSRLAVQLQQYTLAVVAGQAIAGEVVLGDRMSSRAERILKQLEAIRSGVTVAGTSAPPEAEDTTAPAAPTGLTADSSAYQEGGATVAVLHVAWTAVTTNPDGTAADDVAGYRVEYAYAAEPGAWQLGADVTATSADFGSLTAGVEVLVRVRAYDRNGNTSAPSTVFALTTEVDDQAPPAPSAPVVTTRVSILAAAWDGLGSAGEPMPLDLDFVEVHVSAASNFTPTDATYYDRLPPGGGVMPITGRPYGAATFVRLVAVDKSTPSANRSGPSVQGSATPQKLVTIDFGPESVDRASIKLAAIGNAQIDVLAVNAANIGSVNAGTIVSGTVSALLTLSGIIRTDVSPNRRMEITSNGWSAYNTSNQLWAELNLATLSMLVTGTYQSGTTGERINILQDGTMRFYGSSGTSYAEIANNGTNLFFRARASSLTANQGYLYLEPARVYIGYGQPGSLAESHLAAQNDNIEIRSPIIGFRVERRFGNPADGTRPRAVFLHMDNAGTTIASSVLEYSVTGVGSGEAWLQATGQNAGIIFASNNVYISHNDGNPAELRCGNLIELSARRFKDRVRDIGWTRPDGATVTALDVVLGARSREWEYIHDRVRPPRPGLLLSRPRLGDNGQPLFGSDGAEIRDDVEAEWDFPLPDPPKRYGPMADDLKLLAPSLVRSDPDHPDREWVSVSDKLGVLWEAVAQLAERVARRPGGLM